MSKVRITLDRPAAKSKVEIDGVEVDDVVQVSAAVSVDGLPLVIITLHPEQVVIEGESAVRTVARGTPWKRGDGEGGALVPPDVAAGLMEMLERPRQPMCGATRGPISQHPFACGLRAGHGGAHESQPGGRLVRWLRDARRDTPPLRQCSVTASGGLRVCQRQLGHEARHMNMDAGTGELVQWADDGNGNREPTRVHAVTCGRCQRQRRPDLVIIGWDGVGDLFTCGDGPECTQAELVAPRCHHREQLEGGPSPFWCVLIRGHHGAHAVGEVPQPEPGTIGYAYDDHSE